MLEKADFTGKGTAEKARYGKSGVYDREKPSEQFSDGLPAKIDAETLDLFDRIQLQHVIAECRRHPNMAAAGRALFNVSRLERATANDSDRLRKYLQRFGLTWADIR